MTLFCLPPVVVIQVPRPQPVVLQAEGVARQRLKDVNVAPLDLKY